MEEKKAVYKTFEIDGKKVSKWLRECSSYEYDENGNEIFVCEYGNIEKKKKYDSNGRLVFEMDAYGNETEYDKNGNVVHFKNNSNEFWREYDSQGNVIHYKDLKGTEVIPYIEYYENGNIKYSKFCDIKDIPFSANKNAKHIELNTFEKWYDENSCLLHSKNIRKEEFYDIRGNLIHESLTFIKELEFDLDGNLLHKIENNNEIFYDLNGNITIEKTDGITNEYDKCGNLIHTIDSDDNENWYEYDEYGNLIHTENSDGDEEFFESIYEYDSQGNVIYWKNDKGDEKKYERNNVIYKKTKDGYEIWYDMNRKIIHTKGECEETWYEYDNYGNKVYEKSVDGELETTKNITYVYSKNGIVIDSKCVRYSNNNDKRKDTYKWFKYDFNGDRIYYLNEDDTYKYTNDGLLIYTKDSYDDENWYEYEFFENGNVKKVVVFEPK